MNEDEPITTCSVCGGDPCGCCPSCGFDLCQCADEEVAEVLGQLERGEP